MKRRVIFFLCFLFAWTTSVYGLSAVCCCFEDTSLFLRPDDEICHESAGDHHHGPGKHEGKQKCLFFRCADDLKTVALSETIASAQATKASLLPTVEMGRSLQSAVGRYSVARVPASDLQPFDILSRTCSFLS